MDLGSSMWRLELRLMTRDGSTSQTSSIIVCKYSAQAESCSVAGANRARGPVSLTGRATSPSTMQEEPTLRTLEMHESRYLPFA